METTEDNWVNNEWGDFMWDDALKNLEVKALPLETDKEMKQTETEVALNLERKVI